MKIAVYDTGHEIADTVAKALFNGLGGTLVSGQIPFPFADVHIGYGILRGNGELFKECEKQGNHWFELDRGYINPGHYAGYYRISYRGTQAKWHEGIPRKPIDIKIEPWRGCDDTKPILVCPPTKEVGAFFYPNSRNDWDLWWLYYTTAATLHGRDCVVRHKGDAIPINWDDYSAVVTFNSSVGWQALQRGIPVLSDPHHSIIGTYYASKGVTNLQSLTDILSNSPDTRLELFEAMAAHQFTLQEIREGKAWELLKHYLSGSGTIPVKPSQAMFAPIRLDAEPKPL